MKMTANALLCAAFLLSACDNGNEVSASDFGDDWPFTVSSGEIKCIGSSAAVFIHGNTTYQLNGMAQNRGYAPIQPIWRDNPKISGTKVSIAPLLKAALALCQA